MAEEQNTGGQNLWLLLVSLGLGLVVVIIYNVHVYNIRNITKGETIECVAVLRDLPEGEIIKEEDLETRIVPKQYQENLSTVVQGEYKEFAVNRTVNQTVEKGRWLLWEHITAGPVTNAPGKPTAGNVGIGVKIDSRLSPGDILNQNDRVNILGQIDGRVYRIVEAVRVLAIGGFGDKGTGGKGPKIPTSYRNITVELPKDVSLQWNNVQTRINGDCWVEIIPPGSARQVVKINPDLLKYAEGGAAPAAGGTGPMGGGPGGGPGGVGVGIGGSKTWD